MKYYLDKKSLEQFYFIITGADAERYLQGRITNDLRQLTFGKGCETLILNPSGKILGKFQIFKVQGSHPKEVKFLIFPENISSETDAEKFVKNLLLFKVADQVTTEKKSGHTFLYIFPEVEEKKFKFIKQLEEHYNFSAEVYSNTVTGIDLITQASRQKASLPSVFELSKKMTEEENQSPIYLTINPNTFYQAMLVVPSEELPLILRVVDEYTEIFEEDFCRERLQALCPYWMEEINESTSVADIPLEKLVSFNKGCYAGQEVVEMSTARGKPNKFLSLLFVKFDSQKVDSEKDLAQKLSQEETLYKKLEEELSKAGTIEVFESKTNKKVGNISTINFLKFTEPHLMLMGYLKTGIEKVLEEGSSIFTTISETEERIYFEIFRASGS